MSADNGISAPTLTLTSKSTSTAPQATIWRIHEWTQTGSSRKCSRRLRQHHERRPNNHQWSRRRCYRQLYAGRQNLCSRLRRLPRRHPYERTDPFGPIMACTSPASTVRSIPFNISRSPTVACNPLISSKAIYVKFLDSKLKKAKTSLAADERRSTPIKRTVLSVFICVHPRPKIALPDFNQRCPPGSPPATSAPPRRTPWAARGTLPCRTRARSSRPRLRWRCPLCRQ